MAWPETPLNPFYNAPIVVNEIKDHVKSQQLSAVDKADAMRNRAVDAIQSMASRVAGLKLTGGIAPEPDLHASVTPRNFELPVLGQNSFGSVSDIGRRTYTGGSGVSIEGVDVDGFEPSYTQFNLPSAPGDPTAPVFPSAPALSAIGLPSVPTLQYPDSPLLDELQIPDFQFSQLPAFNDTEPTFRDSPIQAVLDWDSAPYEKVVIDEAIDVVRRMFAGGTGLPPAVERALWERANSREDIEAARNVSEAMVEFSSRGYTLPPGALAARVDAVRTDAALRKQGLGREVLIKVTDTHIENLRFAVTQAIGAEQALIDLWNQSAQRGFDVAKHQLDAELAVLNANIAIYNAQQSARQTSAAVYRTHIEMQGLELQKMKLELDGELAKGQINEQKVKVFSELHRSLLTQVEVYKGEMQGAQLMAEMQKLELDKYRTGVEAEAERLKADKVRFEVFESQIKGETAKASLVQAQAQAYGAYVSGVKAKADINIAQANAELQQHEHSLRAFLGNLEADKAFMQSQLASVQANAEAHKTNTQRYVAQAQAQGLLAELDLKKYETQQRNAIALYEAEMRRYVADMEQMIRAASLQLEGAKSIGQAYSTLAAGAMAGISFSSSLGASAGVSASGNSSVSERIERG